MTWVVGANTFFGHAILVSDLRVTFRSPNGSERYFDCLQKIHPLGRFVIGGFAGSVTIGFACFDRLSREFSSAPADAAWELGFIAHDWLPDVIREVFVKSDAAEKTLGCQLLLAAAHPTKDRGIPGWAVTEMFSFTAPQFVPVETKGKETTSIGSGSDVALYVQSVERLTTEFSFHKLMEAGRSLQGRVLANSIHELVRENPIKSVSDLFQVMTVARGEIAVANHEYKTYEKDGTTSEVKFPPLVRNLAELEQFCRNNGLAEGAGIA